MKLLYILSKLIPPAPPSREEIAEKDKEIVRNIVRSKSEGNIRLQMGMYKTEDDAKQDRERLRHVVFSD